MAQKTKLDSYSTTDGSEGEDESAVEPPVTLDEQKQNIAWQLMKLRRKSTEYEEQIEKYYKEYVNLDNQLKQLTRQMPVNYLTDGALIKGFNEDGQLVAIFDNYDNIMTIDYDESGKIVSVYDGENKQITFEYRPDGLLSSITDTRGRRIKYDYENKRLVSIHKSGGKELMLAYDESNPHELTTVTTSENLQSVLEYTDGLLVRVTTKSLLTGISHGQEPTVTEGVALSWCSFSFGDNFTTITNDKGDKKYYKVNDDGNVYEYYEEQNNLIVKAEKYDYVPGESDTQGKDDVYTSSASLMYKKSYDDFIPDFNSGDFIKTELDEFNNPKTKTISARPLSGGTTQEAVVTYEYDDDHKCIKAQ